jgi:hypothetical protein
MVLVGLKHTGGFFIKEFVGCPAFLSFLATTTKESHLRLSF